MPPAKKANADAEAQGSTASAFEGAISKAMKDAGARTDNAHADRI